MLIQVFVLSITKCKLCIIACKTYLHNHIVIVVVVANINSGCVDGGDGDDDDNDDNDYSNHSNEYTHRFHLSSRLADSFRFLGVAGCI